jgi:hypothetical protein
VSIGGDDRSLQELVAGAGLALHDAFDLWSMGRMEFEVTLALLLRADPVGLRQRPLEGGLKVRIR